MSRRGVEVKKTVLISVIIFVLVLFLIFLIFGLGLKINGYNIFDGFVSLELPSGQTEKSVTGRGVLDWFRDLFEFGGDKDKEIVMLGPGDNCTSISQYNITWYFDREYECGQFVNGDWWVLVNPATGVVNVTRVEPAPIYRNTTLGNDGQEHICNAYINDPTYCDQWRPISYLGEYNYSTKCMQKDPSVWNNPYYCFYLLGRNGFEVNPMPGTYYAYDDRAMDYKHSLARSLPILLSANSSIVSSISQPEQTDCVRPGGGPGWYSYGRFGWYCFESKVKRTTVLTVLNSIPSANSFRPAYVGNNKKLYSSSQLRREILLNLTPIPPLPNVSLIIEQAHSMYLNHKIGWTNQVIQPVDNLWPSYGAEASWETGEMVLLTLSNINAQQKEEIMLGLIQAGIDLYGILENGGGWGADGGHASGRKLPILYAGLLLNDSGMLNIGYDYLPVSNIFGEDCQTYYDDNATFPFFYGILGFPRWGIRHCQDLGGTIPSYHDENSDYRPCCNSQSWVGVALAARLLKLEKYWNHQAYFDYEDRYAQTEFSGYHNSGFNDAMWLAYRNTINTCNNQVQDRCSILCNATSGTLLGETGIDIGGNCLAQNCTDGQTQPCPLQNGVCAGSFQTCANNVWSGCNANNYGSNYQTQETLCDNLDNDCDGIVDENCNPPGENCFTSNSSWQNLPFQEQRGIFRAEFNATPLANNIDGVIGLSLGNADAYTDLAVIVRFNDLGVIDVRDGTTYRADVSVPYTSGINFHFRLVVNILTHRYNVYVKPQGSSELLLASNYAFRTEQNNVVSLDNLASITSVGTHDICDLNAVSESAGICGDGNINIGEQCDLNNLNSQTCETQNYPAGGTLRCNVNCEFNYNECSLMPTFSQFNGNTTNFTNVNINNVENATLEKTQFGKIDFSGNVINFTRIDLDSYVFIEDKKIGIFTGGNNFIARLDLPATLWFYNIGFTQPVVKKDGVICNNCSTVSYTNSIFIVSVNGFSNYTVEEGYSVPPSGTGGNGGGGGGGTTVYQCNDGKDNDNDGKIDYPNDKGCINGIDNSELDEVCNTLWSCTDWSSCVDGKQTRSCRDLNNCGISDGKPSEERDCGAAEGEEEGREETGVQITPALKNFFEKIRTFAGKAFSEKGKKSFLISFVVFTVLIIVLAITLMLKERGKKLLGKKKNVNVEERLR